MEQQERVTRKRIQMFIFLVILGSVFTLFFLAFQGNRDQVYHDILIEITSMFSSNKSAEQKLLYILALGGALLYTVYYLWSKKTYGDVSAVGASSMDDQSIGKCFLWGIGVMAGIYYLTYSKIDPMWMMALLVGVFLYLLDQSLVLSGICFFFLAVYGVCGLYRGYVFVGGQQALSSLIAASAALVLTLILLLGKDRRRTLIRGCLAAQVCIPATLLVFFASSYFYKGQMIVLPITRKAMCVVGLLLVSFVLEAVWILVRSWKKDRKVNEIIAYGACVSIMAFNRYSGTGALMTSDMHHPFENIISYSQMVELGQKAFSQYIPVSGLYPLLQGAVFRFFGHGQFGHYYLTQNLFYLFVILLLVMLLWYSVDRVYILLIALTTIVFNYNRVAFILPIMLLLTLPRLVERKNLWLKVWMLSSLFHGLYYPVFGAAVCVGFLPLGIWQLREFIRCGEFKEQAKTPVFWLSWLACFVPVVLAVPWLWGTYRHIKAMGGQTVLADGIARFGQIVWDEFLPYLTDYPAFRMIVYNLLTFMVPSVFVWLVAALALKTAGIRFEGRKILVENGRESCIVIAPAIVLLIACTYTFVRLDVNDIFSRNNGVLLAGTAMLLVAVNRYLKDSAAKYAVVFALCFIPSMAPWMEFLDSDRKLEAVYPVADGYVLVVEDDVKLLGRGFVDPSVYDRIHVYDQWLKEDKEASYLGIGPGFGYFYLLELKGVGTLEMGTIKGIEAAREAIHLAKENQAVIGAQVNPFDQYYMYHWLVTSGDYLWSGEKERFFPNTGEITVEEVRREHKDLSISWNKFKLGRNAGSLGQSIDRLMGVFSRPELEVAVSPRGAGADLRFSREIDGDEADFLYLDFSGLDETFVYTLYDLEGEVEQPAGFLSKYFMKKSYNPGMQVVVSWKDDQGEEHTINCDMWRGKLLISLGSGLKWLLNHHEGLSISVLQNGQEIPIPELREVRMLKLREAQ